MDRTSGWPRRRAGGLCPRCGTAGDRERREGYCQLHHALWQLERARARALACWVLSSRLVVILDTETTGLDGAAEVVEVTLISAQGRVLFDWLVRHHGPIRASATSIHRLGCGSRGACAAVGLVYRWVASLLHRKIVVVNNAAYDRRLLQQTCTLANLPALRSAVWHCAMHEYATFTGVWNVAKRNYRWHKLHGGDHPALGDRRGTWAIVRGMAEVE